MILLDTHALLWWLADRARLSPVATEAIDAQSQVAVSTISVMEIARLLQRGRIELAAPLDRWLDVVTGEMRVRLIPVDRAVAQLAGQLDWSHGDPADRLIAATALTLEAPLVSADIKIRQFGRVRVIW